MISYPSLSELRGCCCESKRLESRVIFCCLPIRQQKVMMRNFRGRTVFGGVVPSIQQLTSVPSRGKAEQGGQIKRLESQ